MMLFLKDKPSDLHPFHIRRASSSSSFDIVPDSMATSDWENMSDDAFFNSESHTSGDQSLEPSSYENHVLRCQGHEQKTTLLVLPNSTSDPSYDHSCINAIGTAMMRLRAAEDEMIREILTVMDLSPESASQLEKYISPNIHERLKTRNSRSKLALCIVSYNRF